ncbi:hypothetical protein [Bradyrhizobium valentinum]|nr:hypothetical protein [Bradyrhizobium valentinum]
MPPRLMVNDMLKLFLVGYDCTEFGSGGSCARRALSRVQTSRRNMREA